MEFTTREDEDGFTVLFRGEVLATFQGTVASGILNPAFLMFAEGLRQIPEADLWNESRARYEIQKGEVCNEDLAQELEGLRAWSSDPRKGF